MAVKWQVDFDTFFGGMSDIDTRMWVWQYSYSDNIEVRRDPDYCELALKPTLLFTTTERIYNAISVYTSWWFTDNKFFFGENWVVYNENGVQTATLPSWEDIFFSIYFAWGNNPRLYFFYTEAGEVRIGELNDSTGAIINPNVSLLPIPAESIGFCYPIVNVSDDFLYIGTWKNVYRITQQPWWLFWQLAISFEDTITWITNTGNLLKVYLRSWKIYYWDWFSEQYDTYQEINTRVNYVYNDWAIDYLFGWRTQIVPELHVVQWLQNQIIKQTVISEWSEGRNKYTFRAPGTSSCNKTVQKYRNINYTVVLEEFWPEVSNNKIMSFGNEYNWFPASYVNQCSVISNGNRAVNIDMIHIPKWWVSLFYSRQDTDGNFWVDSLALTQGIVSTSEYQSEWVIYSQKYILDHLSTKRIFEPKMRADTSPWQTIEIAYSLDGWPYQILTTVGGVDSERPESKYVYILNSIPEDDFNEIQFRYTLRTNDPTLTPRLYSFRMPYELNER